jgi:hypothetical protein
MTTPQPDEEEMRDVDNWPEPDKSDWRDVVIILGLILIILGYTVAPGVFATVGWVLLLIGIVLFAIGGPFGRPVGGRRHWY